jgi:Domain of unknown function (DUF4265)
MTNLQNKDTVKLSFLLSEDQSGPFPISTESLWCDVEGKYYRLKSIPFFVDGISFDDLIEVSKAIDGNFKIEQVIEPSKNSTVWLYFKDEQNGQKMLDSLLALGCGVEGGVFDGYFSVNVPHTIDFNKVQGLVHEGQQLGYVSPDYPSIRHIN